MPNLSIKNVPENVVARLRAQAKSHHRSLQGELLDIVCRATDDTTQTPDRNESSSEQSGWLTIEEVAAELNGSKRKPASASPLAVDIIRGERDTR